MIDGVPAEIGTDHLSDRYIESYGYTYLLAKNDEIQD
jgi:hypothetical protein